MKQERIDRINTLYHKSQAVGLTEEEKKEQEENPDSDGLKYEEKESERLAHQQRDELLREILNEDNKLKL